MTQIAELELPLFDYTQGALSGERFHEAMAELRSQGWIAAGPFDSYIVLDREAAEFFLRTRSAIFPGMKIAEIFGVTEGALYEQMRRNILHVNGPDHTRLRSLVNPALAPRAVERYRPQMRDFLQLLLDQASESGARDGGPVRCDFVEAFAKPYPSMAIATVMGAPIEDAAKLHHWSNWIQRQFDALSMASHREQIEQAVEEFYVYARGLVQVRRDDPSDDLISKLIEAEEEGQKLDEEECINLVFNVLAGGVDTTQSQLAHAVRLLAEHPDQWAALVADPSLAEQAVEEALRYEPITPFTARILTEEVVFRDVVMPADTIVIVCAFTGNRDLDDPAHDAEANGARPVDADVFDITAARPHARTLTFGAGVHYCLGANLARLEMQEALTFLSARLRDLALDGEPEYESITGIYGLARLPISFSL